MLQCSLNTSVVISKALYYVDHQRRSINTNRGYPPIRMPYSTASQSLEIILYSGTQILYINWFISISIGS